MATVINNPGGTGDNAGGWGPGAIIGIILAIIVVFVLLVYGIPAMRSTRSTGGPSVNVPSDVNINVNKGQ